MPITRPTLVSVNYDFENKRCKCSVKYNVLGVIKSFEELSFDSDLVLQRAGTNIISDSLESCRSMCEEALNIPVVLYSD